MAFTVRNIASFADSRAFYSTHLLGTIANLKSVSMSDSQTVRQKREDEDDLMSRAHASFCFEKHARTSPLRFTETSPNCSTPGANPRRAELGGNVIGMYGI